MKKTISILLALGMVFCLAACGDGGNAGDDVVGKYSFSSMEKSGMTLDADSLSALGLDPSMFSLEIKEDGTFVMNVPYEDDVETVNGTWEKSGDYYAMTADGSTINATYDAAEKTLTLAEDDQTMVFKK